MRACVCLARPQQSRELLAPAPAPPPAGTARSSPSGARTKHAEAVLSTRSGGLTRKGISGYSEYSHRVIAGYSAPPVRYFGVLRVLTPGDSDRPASPSAPGGPCAPGWPGFPALPLAPSCRRKYLEHPLLATHQEGGGSPSDRCERGHDKQSGGARSTRSCLLLSGPRGTHKPHFYLVLTHLSRYLPAWPAVPGVSTRSTRTGYMGLSTHAPCRVLRRGRACQPARRGPARRRRRSRLHPPNTQTNKHTNGLDD
jgi:hypothetical protein